MDTTQTTELNQAAAELAAVADELLRRLATIDAAEAPPVADELAANLALTLDLREGADEPLG